MHSYFKDSQQAQKVLFDQMSELWSAMKLPGSVGAPTDLRFLDDAGLLNPKKILELPKKEENLQINKGPRYLQETVAASVKKNTDGHIIHSTITSRKNEVSAAVVAKQIQETPKTVKVSAPSPIKYKVIYK